MFRFDPDQSYMMPAHFGPRPMGENSSGWYHDVTMMVVSRALLADQRIYDRFHEEVLETSLQLARKGLD